jgi:small-conductance mechanosensitive channel
VNSVAIAAMVWLANRALQVGVSAMEEASDHTDASGRSFKTSMQVTRRLVGIIIWVVGISVFLLQFQVVRSVGLSLLASAGIAGVAFGFAAQRSIAQLLAGIQLSLTQPIRLGDQVTIDKQFGEVEEIHLTYVVLRTWDLKRLVVPINRFLDGVFENWSLGSLKVMAAVNLKLDYSADIDALRAEVQRLLATDSAKVLWDQTVWRVRVLETDTQSVSVRISVSVPDASKGFELECLLREALLGYLRARPSWLSRGRSETISLGPKDAVG